MPLVLFVYLMRMSQLCMSEFWEHARSKLSADVAALVHSALNAAKLQYRTERASEIQSRRQADVAASVTAPYAAKVAADATASEKAKLGKNRKTMKREKEAKKQNRTSKQNDRKKKRKKTESSEEETTRRRRKKKNKTESSEEETTRRRRKKTNKVVPLSIKWSQFEDKKEDQAEDTTDSEDSEEEDVAKQAPCRELVLQEIVSKRTIGKESKGGIRKQYQVRWAGKASNGKAWALRWVDCEEIHKLDQAKVDEFEQKESERCLTEAQRAATDELKKASLPSVDKIYQELVKVNPGASQYQLTRLYDRARERFSALPLPQRRNK